MQPSKHATDVLMGKKAIMDYLQISRDSFYELIKIGLPAAVINNRYYAHKINIDAWFQAITRTQSRIPKTDAD